MIKIRRKNSFFLFFYIPFLLFCNPSPPLGSLSRGPWHITLYIRDEAAVYSKVDRIREEEEEEKR